MLMAQVGCFVPCDSATIAVRCVSAHAELCAQAQPACLLAGVTLALSQTPPFTKVTICLGLILIASNSAGPCSACHVD